MYYVLLSSGQNVLPSLDRGFYVPFTKNEHVKVLRGLPFVTFRQCHWSTFRTQFANAFL